MITVHTRGGLGNQMFQYACGRALALRNNDLLQITRSEHQGDIHRPFSLTAFNIIGDIIPSNQEPVLPKIVAKLRQQVTRNFYVNFQPGIVKRKGNIYLDGYFQSEKYFIDKAEFIRQDLTLKSPLTGEASKISALIKARPGAVSLHVRRGDYVNHVEFDGVVTNEYYNRATKEMLQRVPNAYFFVFSDDIDWCRDNLELNGNITFISDSKSDLKDYEELSLMSLCQHHIIANSSFSWWGAWLGQNSDKFIIAPKRWSNLHEEWYRDIIPSTWTRL